MGWIGSHEELLQALRTFKVDQDEEGKFCVGGQIVSFLGAGEEFVVGDSAIVYVNGEPKNLCSLLETTNLGKKVTVI